MLPDSYRDELAYPTCGDMAFEFDLPVPLDGEGGFACSAGVVSVNRDQRSRNPAADDRRFAGASKGRNWCNGTSRSARTRTRRTGRTGEEPRRQRVLDGPKLSGRKHLGGRCHAAHALDSALVGPKRPRSRRSIVYSGRQHANEVSSTSHIFKLGEQLVSDPATRADAQAGERGAASDHESGRCGTFGATG